MREIPIEAKKIKKGLYLHEYNKIINDNEYTFRHLYSSEGYCFYDTDLDTKDEEGNLNPRTYYQYMSLGLNKSLDTIISIPIEDGMEIA